MRSRSVYCHCCFHSYLILFFVSWYKWSLSNRKWINEIIEISFNFLIIQLQFICKWFLFASMFCLKPAVRYILKNIWLFSKLVIFKTAVKSMIEEAFETKNLKQKFTTFLFQFLKLFRFDTKETSLLENYGFYHYYKWIVLKILSVWPSN
jgi:hypothetical protein